MERYEFEMGDTLYLKHTSSHMVYSPHTKYFREKNVGCRSFTFTSRIHQEVISFLHVVSYYILSVLFFVWSFIRVYYLYTTPSDVELELNKIV